VGTVEKKTLWLLLAIFGLFAILCFMAWTARTVWHAGSTDRTVLVINYSVAAFLAAGFCQFIDQLIEERGGRFVGARTIDALISAIGFLGVTGVSVGIARELWYAAWWLVRWDVHELATLTLTLAVLILIAIAFARHIARITYFRPPGPWDRLRCHMTDRAASRN